MISKGVWLVVDNASAAVFAFLFFVMTARWLPPAEFGAAALALSLAQIATPMIESLFHDALIQRENLQDRHIRTATAATLAWAALLAMLLWVVAPEAAALFDAPALGACLPWLGLALIGSGLMAVPAALARRRMEFRLLALRTLIARSVATLVGVALLLSGAGIWAVVVQFALSALLSAAFLLLTTPRPLRLALDPSAFRDLFGFALPTMGTQMLAYANSRIVTLLIGGLLGTVAAGAWNVAMRFVEPLQTMAATTIGQLALPLYARRQDDRDALARGWALGTRRAAFVMVPMFIGLGVCAEPVIELFVGPRWIGVAPVMSFVCVVTALIMARQLGEIVFTSIGLPRINLVLHLQATLLSLAGAAVGAAFGLFPAAIGWGLRVLPFLTSSAWLLRKRAAIGFADQVRVVAGPFLAAAVMAAGLVGAQAFLSDLASPGLRLLWLIPLGGLIYLVTLMLFDAQARADAGMALSRLSRRNRAQSSGS